MNDDKKWIYVINPKGVMVEVDEARWPELNKKGYTLLGSNPSDEIIRIDKKEYLGCVEV